MDTVSRTRPRGALGGSVGGLELAEPLPLRGELPLDRGQVLADRYNRRRRGDGAGGWGGRSHGALRHRVARKPARLGSSNRGTSRSRAAASPAPASLFSVSAVSSFDGWAPL